MNCAYLRDLIKTMKPDFEKYYVGKLDNKYEKSICVYSLKSQNNRAVAIGGEKTSKTKTANFSILIHYNKNYTETETISQLLYDKLAITKQIKLNSHFVNYIEMLSDSAIDLHTDENGVYERLIDIRVYYN